MNQLQGLYQRQAQISKKGRVSQNAEVPAASANTVRPESEKTFLSFCASMSLTPMHLENNNQSRNIRKEVKKRKRQVDLLVNEVLGRRKL